MSDLKQIRNFCIIAHIDHGKSTLADRMLELTGTIEKRKMQEQVLDSMELERERGITIKMTPVRMIYHSHRGLYADKTQNDAESELLYKDLSYKVRGIIFSVRKKLGLGHKEQIYHNAIEIELKNAGIFFESRRNIPITYEGNKIGSYQPDFVIDDKIIIELKALPEIGRPQIEQVWSYLKGCEYKLAFLVNFGSKELEIKRFVYDTARDKPSASILPPSASSQRDSAGVSSEVEYTLNLIDTPGHIDFAYEVSRSLKAVEGCILLIDATQGVQAQTLTTLGMAKDAGLTVIPVVNKIDSPLARVPEVKKEVALLLGCNEDEILEVSGKTGEGVKNLLDEVVRRIPPPQEETSGGGSFRALVFDFQYSNHTGVIVHMRVFDGGISKDDKLLLTVPKKEFSPIELGVFSPEPRPVENLSAGEIGYLVTGIKEPGIAFVGDTITLSKKPLPALSGFMTPHPVVWASVYPESQDDFNLLRQALDRLRLSDSSFTHEEESSGALGRGFRCGFLGMLHLEIITERLRREFNLELIITVPSITYEVVDRRGRRIKAYSPAQFPEYGEIAEVFEPWVSAKIIVPSEYIGLIMPMLYDHEATVETTEDFGDNRATLTLEIPLRELMRNFFDKLKSASSGFASLSYTIGELRKADVVKLEVLVADEPVTAFARVVSRRRLEIESEEAVEKLSKILPRQMFTTKIQAKALGRIISSRTLSAMRKDVTQHMYGGDITRKMKLREKQKKGKKKMRDIGRVNIPQDVFLKMMKSGN
jgi:GTP-binding protein LepA